MQVLRVEVMQMIFADLRCGQVKHHLPVTHTDDAWKGLERHLHMVQGSDQRGFALGGNVCQGFDGLFAPGWIQRRQRLVYQQQLCIRGQNSCQAHALAFTARQAVNPFKQLLAQVEPGQGRICCINVRRVKQAAQTGPQAHLRQTPCQHCRNHTLARRQGRHLGCQKELATQLLQAFDGQVPRIDVT